MEILTGLFDLLHLAWDGVGSMVLLGLLASVSLYIFDSIISVFKNKENK
jgi:hypothetical protein